MPTSSGKMTREEAIIYCDKHLPRVPASEWIDSNNASWTPNKGWGPHFNVALWFSEFGDYFYIPIRDPVNPRDFEHIKAGVATFKRHVLIWRLIGAESRND